jgi:hypothetical protein
MTATHSLYQVHLLYTAKIAALSYFPQNILPLDEPISVNIGIRAVDNYHLRRYHVVCYVESLIFRRSISIQF